MMVALLFISLVVLYALSFLVASKDCQCERNQKLVRFVRSYAVTMLFILTVITLACIAVQ